MFFQILKRARELGDFLLVGIHSDETVRYIFTIEYEYYPGDGVNDR